MRSGVDRLQRITALTAAILGFAASMVVMPSAGAAPMAVDANPLVWDATEKALRPKPGETSTGFQFTVTNTADKPVTILQIRPTCGCTIAEMPSDPWVLAPHETGSFIGSIDFRGQAGTLTKAIFVNTTAGTQRLTLVVKVPEVDESSRARNRKIAQANPQAIFGGDCAKCHLEPARGLAGAELFTAACGVCHLTPRRAPEVPDLLTARQHRDARFWRTWIADGKRGTLMPAWSKARGGPLSDEQIDSLVKFALETLPTEPPPPAPSG